MNLSDYPTTEERQIPWKLIGIIGGGVLLVIIIVAIVFRITGSKSEQVLIQQVAQQETSRIVSECDDAKDVEECLKNKTDEIAMMNGDVEMCQTLEGLALGNCIWGVARETEKPELCGQIAEDKRKINCFNELYRVVALKESDVGICLNITNPTGQEGCKNVILGSITTENCQERGKDAAYCQMLAVGGIAAEKQDKSICEQIEDETLLTECLEFVDVDDPDFDGLSSESEAGYGTDPHNPDTDGDGFSDGDEVEAGYNPAGEGRL